jgi:2-C-methyl-D-erythritol 4-phosphate cytidylyltransferase/2-C-methyl-D-erythritol 2,4-cyclodiphosphate synthase
VKRTIGNGSGPRIAAVIAAGGVGARMSSAVPKQFLDLAGKPILVRTLEQVLNLEGVVHAVVALPRSHIPRARAILAGYSWSIPIQCIAGGPTRQESVRRAVARTRADAEIILVHDAVRPFSDPSTMERVIRAAWENGSAVPGLPATETIQRVSTRNRIRATPPRDELYAIQTPQCFRAGILKTALARAYKENFAGTDESSIVRWAGHSVVVVPGSAANIKITSPQDLRLAEVLITAQADKELATKAQQKKRPTIRIGQGIDYHRFAEGRKLILGGVEIPFEKGLLGHSDADVLVHAVCDALLGAAAMGDIGRHFPDNDPLNRNRSSLEFLREIGHKCLEAGWRLGNLDATLLVQRPRLAPFMEAMRGKIAECLDVTVEQVSIKATTTEEMNAEGRGEGISAQAIALLEWSRPTPRC